MNNLPGEVPTQPRAATTRAVLLTTLLLLVAALTGASLFMVWHRMSQQVTSDFTLALNQSTRAFKATEAERLSTLTREGDLMADLPSLKALMTTNDDRTIEDGAVGFWRTSGNDLFAVVGRDSRVRAVYVRDMAAGEDFRRDLSHALQTSGRQYLLSGGRLFRYSVAPIYFGEAESGVLLGYVVNGYAIDTAYLRQLNGQADADRAFVSGDTVLASSLPLPDKHASSAFHAVSTAQPQTLTLDGARYLAVSRDLSAQATGSLQLVFFKSLREPEREIHEISRLLLGVGVCIVLLGSVAMLLVARRLTGPLEELTRRVRDFGSGGAGTPAVQGGTREVRQLAADFEAMQQRIERSNRARLESERLATIGSMASSVSHDLRHYLASIYANAEFLAASTATDAERAEFLDDIRTAVLGTTEMLESLMIFGRTGQSVRHAPQRLDMLLRRAVAQVRTHPEALGVHLSVDAGSGDTGVIGDGKQLERALYNLLLNACQSARAAGGQARVTASILHFPSAVAVRVEDNGVGVAPAVQTTLFDPFVSEGKQNGTGLGLTLCRCIAEEHDGSVQVISGAPGATVFELRLPRIGDDSAAWQEPSESRAGVQVDGY